MNNWIVKKHTIKYMKKLLLVTGIILSTIGLTYIIIDLNLLIMGYTFFDYLKYIFTKFECLIFFIGYLFIIVSIYERKKI